MYRKSLFSFLLLVLFTAVASAQNKGDETDLDGLKSRVPASWKQKETDGRMRILHFILPKEKGDEHDGEFVVFFFGKGGGGGVDANITRWKSMMTAPAGKSIDDLSKVEKIKVGDAPVTVLDVSGIYTHKTRPFDPNDKGEKRDDYRLIGIIIESENGPFFIRITGPAKTIAAHKKGIDDWLKHMK